MREEKNKFRLAFTLMELVVVIIIVAIPITAMGILLAGGSKTWQQTYSSVHSQIKEDAQAATAALGSIGRQANRSNYKIYRLVKGSYTEAQPALGSDIAFGQAVEFRYWNTPFQPSAPSADAIDVTNTGTHYALFYLDGDKLKIDYGQVKSDIGAINGNSKTTPDKTVLLADNVDIQSGTDIFSHTVSGGRGSGNVRMNLRLLDKQGRRFEIKASAMPRIVWPR